MTYQTQSKIVNTPVSNSYMSESESFPEINSVRDADMMSLRDSTDISNRHFRNLHKIINKNPIEDEDDLFQLVKQINNYISKNPEINSIDSKDLNAEITIKGYAFSKNHGELKLMKKYYTPMCRSKTKPLDDKINTIEVMLNQLKQETSQYIKQMEIRINTIEQCLKVIQDDNDKQDILLTKVINFINDNFIEEHQPQQINQNTSLNKTISSNPLDFLRNKF